MDKNRTLKTSEFCVGKIEKYVCKKCDYNDKND